MAIEFKIAHSIKYGKYKYYKNVIVAVMDLIDYNEDLIRDMLDLPDRLKIEFKPLSHKLNGRYFSMTNKVVINNKLTPKALMQTLFHELVHAEQYKTGRLKRELCVRKRKYVSYWNNVEIDSADFRKNYDKYRNLPWEMEAFGREEELLKEFLRKATTP
jgi:hypothetical protein